MVLLSGARGNLGSAFSDYFQAQGVRFVPLYWDSFNKERLRQYLEGAEIDLFINCAALSENSTSHLRPYEYFQTNCIGVLNQLEIIRRFSPKTKYVTFGSVYEKSNKEIYASTKRVSREILDSYVFTYNLWATQITLGLTEYYSRSSHFLTRKIVNHLVYGKSTMSIKNMEEEFYWTWAIDVVKEVLSYCQNEYPPQVEINSCVGRTLREFVSTGAEALGYDGYWRGRDFVVGDLVLFTDVNDWLSFSHHPRGMFVPRTNPEEMIHKLVLHEKEKRRS